MAKKAGPRAKAGEQAGAARGEERIRQRNEKAILRAATTLFAKKGFDGTRATEIAERAGLPKANLYYYFNTKEEIYRAAIRHLIAGWDKALRHIRADADPFEALEAYVREKLDYARKNADESRMFANEIISGAPFLSRADRKHMHDITLEKTLIIEQWVAEGRMRPVNPRHLFIVLWSTTQFYTNFEKITCDTLEKPRLSPSDYEDAARTIVETVLRGLRPGKAASDP